MNRALMLAGAAALLALAPAHAAEVSLDPLRQQIRLTGQIMPGDKKMFAKRHGVVWPR